jgi:succinoglycan biosynthesis transport protein ExoP
MRFAFWRKGKEEAQAEAPIAKPAPAPVKAAAPAPSGDVDLHALGSALARKRGWIIVPTALAFVLSLAIVNVITPRYKSEARILIDGRENVFLRPNSDRATEERSALDAEAVTSQVQLVLSRDLAREIIRKNRLAERPEFDPVLGGMSPLKSLLSLFGIGRDPFSMTPEERVLDAYYERLTVFSVDKSRVIVIEFQSRDSELAAKVANSIAENYLVLQQNARQQQAKSASNWLSGEIDNLRTKVSEADARVEDFRSKSNLFVGTNNTTLSNQQMGELNTQLNNARALKSDAEAKSRLIRDMVQGNKPVEASEILNSELVRRLSEQRVTLRAQLAEQSSTLLGNHPRIKELKAQLGDLDGQIRDEATKISRSLDNDARIAGNRVESLSAQLDLLKKQASSTNGQDVQLRALEREAKAQRDLLESYLAKYREANARENIEAPADARVISRAIVSNTLAYPKKLPIVLIATLAMLLLSSGLIVTGELLAMTAPRAVAVLAAPIAAVRARVEPAAEVERVASPPVAPALVDARLEISPQIGEIDRLADMLRNAGEAGHKVTILGTASGDSITLTALTLARQLARDSRVVVVDLAASSPTMAAISADPSAPGLAELMLGEASFSQIITKDRLSRVHIVNAGRPGFDRTQLQSPRLTLAIDALLRVYDHVLLDAGTATDLPAELLTGKARAVVVPEASMPQYARELMSEQLKLVGFSEVTMLDRPASAGNAAGAGLSVVAA